MSFRREKYIPRGGPDGGDGGKGGDVIIQVTSRKRTLQQFRYKREFKAPNGGYGQGQQRSGKAGEDLIIELPPGTVILDNETGEVIFDAVEDGQSFIVARGGRGGRGNRRFVSSTNRAPRHAQPGEPGEIKALKLDLKLLADVGIIGFPNAGKSTLISRVSSAKPKIADYPFTTLNPILGVVQTGGAEPFVLADIPGLIEGAHTGAGLGIRFLRHVERTGLLLHLIDAASIDSEDPLATYRSINRELAGFSPELAEKAQIIVLNKIDLPDAKQNVAAFEAALADRQVFRISAATGEGLDSLLQALNYRINAGQPAEQPL